MGWVKAFKLLVCLFGSLLSPEVIRKLIKGKMANGQDELIGWNLLNTG